MTREMIRRPDLQLETFHGMMTVAPEMLSLFRRIQRVARSDATVLVRGETGTGKELVAHAVHQAGPRRQAAFSAVNCATFTPELLASELFGHLRGAFTGASADKAGLFAQADGGTLFLDEIAELPVELQARLLRVLQERAFVPVGGTEEVSVDVRLISATNASLRHLVHDGRFREDLMYRVRVVVLYLPRLVDRTGDLEALTWHFIDQFNEQGLRAIRGIDPRVWHAMSAYGWPGNIRELRNVLEQAFVLGEGPVLTCDDLPPELAGPDPQCVQLDPILPAEPLSVDIQTKPVKALTLEDIQRDQIVEAIRKTGGRREEAAVLLGISRSTLYRRLKALGLL